MAAAPDKCPQCKRSFAVTPRRCCLQSGFHFPDQIPILAINTLPEILELKPSSETGNVYSVFSRTWIPTRSIFGPLVAPLMPRTPRSTARFAVGTDKKGWQDCSLASDVQCNWMKYVQTARSTVDQNLTAFQLDGQVYFAAVRNITLGDELKVVCSESYAADLRRSLIIIPRPINVTVNEKKKRKLDLDFDELVFDESVGENPDFDADWTPEQEASGFKSWPCLICERTFLYMANLNSHYKAHLKNGTYKCPKCEHSTADLAAVKRHIKRHKVKKLYEFNQADIRRKQTAAADESRNPQLPILDPDSDNYDCSICGLNFGNQLRLEVHAATHLKWRPIKCDQCEHTFKHPEHLQQHIRLIHDNVNGTRKARYDGTTPARSTKEKDYMDYILKCRDCKLGFLARKKLIEHMHARHPHLPLTSVPELNFPVRMVPAYRCVPCHVTFDSEVRYQKHVTTKHAANPGEAKLSTFNYTAHYCEMCEKPFFGAADYVQHMRKHPGFLEKLMNGQPTG